MNQALLIVPSVPDSDDDIVRTLRRIPDLVVHVTTDALTFLQGIARADVVLVHHGLANEAAFTLVQWLKGLNLSKPIIAVGLPEQLPVIVDYYEAGVTSYLLFADDPATVRSTIHDALSGMSRLDGRITSELIQRLSTLRQRCEEDVVILEPSLHLRRFNIAAGME